MKYAKILTYKYKGQEWTLDGDDYEGLVWLSNTDKPTKNELDSYWQEVQNTIATAEKAKLDAKAAAEAKLAALGLTADDLKALGL